MTHTPFSHFVLGLSLGYGQFCLFPCQLAKTTLFNICHDEDWHVRFFLRSLLSRTATCATTFFKPSHQKKKYNQAKKKSKKQKEIYHHHISTVLSTSSSNAPRSKASLQQDIQTATEALAKDPNNSELLYARGISAISLSRDVTNPNYWGEVNDEASWLNGLADLQRAHQLRYFQGK